jgi:chromosome segregation ATPase
VIAQWQDSYSLLHQKYLELEKTENEKMLEQEGLRRSVAEHQGIVDQLEKRLAEVERDSTDTISQWQTSHAALQDQCTELQVSLDEKIRMYEAALQDLSNERFVSADLQQQLDACKQEMSSLEVQWQQKYSELQSQFSVLEQSQGQQAELDDMRRQLQEQENNANEVVRQWQESYFGLQERYSELERQIEKVKSSASVEMSTLLGRVEEMEGKFSDQASEEMQYKISELEAALEASQHQLSQGSVNYNLQLADLQVKYKECLVQRGDLEQKLAQYMTQVEASEGVDASAKAEIDLLRHELQLQKSQLTSQAEELAKEKLYYSEFTTLANKEVADLRSLIQDKNNEIQSLKQTIDSLNAAASRSLESLGPHVSQLDDGGESSTQQQLVSEDIGTSEVVSTQTTTVGDFHADRDYTDVSSRESELELLVEDLKRQLEEIQVGAASIVEEWQSSYKALEEENAQLSQRIESMVVAGEPVHSSDDPSLHANTTTTTSASTSPVENQTVIPPATDGESQTDSGIVDELQATIRDLEKKLKIVEDDATRIVLEWQESYESLQSEHQQLIERLAVLEATGVGMNPSTNSGSSPLVSNMVDAVNSMPGRQYLDLITMPWCLVMFPLVVSSPFSTCLIVLFH